MKVVEARGLMARDGMLGKSDPYANLTLTGRLVISYPVACSIHFV